MLAPLRLVVGAVLSAIVLVTAVMAFQLGGVDGAYEPGPLLALPLLGGAVAALLTETIGYRHPAIAPGTAKDDAMRASRTAFQSGTTLRFAIAEGVWLLTIGLGFAFGEGGFLAVLVAAVVAFALTWFECWPRERPVARTQASLERDGGVSHLREALGMRTDTVIQEL